MIENKKIAIIGCGNLGSAIAFGLLDKIPAKHLYATRRNPKNLQKLADKGVNCLSDNSEAVQQADVIILAVKPCNVAKILDEVRPHLQSSQILISLATAVPLEDLRQSTELDLPIFRAMPNTAAEVGESMTCLATINQDASTRSLVQEIFDAIGESIYIDESLMDAATVIDACGIAYVLRFIRAMIQGGIQIGFDAQTATDIVTQTVKGAAELLIENDSHPESEIDKVTTPKGCTIVGLNEMEHNGFSSALIKGIVASFDEIA